MKIKNNFGQNFLPYVLAVLENNSNKKFKIFNLGNYFGLCKNKQKNSGFYLEF